MVSTAAERDEGLMLPGLEPRGSRRPALASGAVDDGVIGSNARC